MNLTPLKVLFNRIIPGEDVERYIISRYKMIPTNDRNTIKEACDHINKKLYMDNNDRPYSDLLVFYRENVFITHLEFFYNTLQHYILKHTDPYILDMEYESTISDDEQYIVRFKILKRIEIDSFRIKKN